MPDSTKDTEQHIRKVQARMGVVIHELRARAELHDASKLREPEKSGFDTLSEQLGALVYGSPEYKAALAAGKPTIEHHYAVNDHHPEHWLNGIAGMSLLSITEMLCDWKAASERTAGGSLAQSLPINRERFGIDDQLFSILENTARELGW